MLPGEIIVFASENLSSLRLLPVRIGGFGILKRGMGK